ncbi:MAG: hypothetical protein ACO32O_03245, partial [Ilumatobacteraceae bacterium]
MAENAERTPSAHDPETSAITAGRDLHGALSPALWASSTWDTTDLDGTHRGAKSVHSTGFYSRYANPTVDAFERTSEADRAIMDQG